MTVIVICKSHRSKGAFTVSFALLPPTTRVSYLKMHESNGVVNVVFNFGRCTTTCPLCQLSDVQTIKFYSFNLKGIVGSESGRQSIPSDLDMT